MRLCQIYEQAYCKQRVNYIGMMNANRIRMINYQFIFKILLVTFIGAQSAFAAGNAVTGPALPSFTPFNNSTITTCYRWMPKEELIRWQKNGPQFAYILTDALEREGNRKAIYCWKNTIGAILGGFDDRIGLEEYGSYLVRIDLNPNAVIYDRNIKAYFRVGGAGPIPEKKQLGMSSDIVYELFYNNAKPWFQEYIVRTPEAILSWTDRDEKLQKQFNDEIELLKNKKIQFLDYHFFRWSQNYNSPELPNREDSFSSFYLKKVLERQALLNKYWGEIK